MKKPTLYLLLIGIVLPILFANVLNAQQPAVPIEISGNNAIPNDLDLNHWTDQWRAPQAVYDRGSYQDDPDNWSQDYSGEGSTWWQSGGSPQYGILVIDMNQLRTLNRFRVFQMFSDGKTTGIRIFKNTDFTGDMPPLSSGAGWVEVTSGVTSVGAGMNNATYISDPTQINVSAFSSRYIMLYAYNDGSLGNPSYIELKGIKGFYYNGSSYSINYLRGGPPVWNSGGSGTLADPYLVNNLENLKYLSKWFKDFGSNYFKQTIDIDAAATSTWNGGAGFSPIGTSSPDAFHGSYDGNGHTISNLFINRPSTDFVGLFGYIGIAADPSAVKNLGVINVNVTGRAFVGGLVGCIVYGIVTHSYSTGSVTGSQYYIGGLAGSNSTYSSATGKISNCYSECSVTGNTGVGGLVGNHDGLLEYSHSSGPVDGYQWVGGLVGCLYRGSIKQCHSASDATGSGGYVGGLIGYYQGQNWQPGEIVQNSYGMGSATGPTHVGGLVGHFLAGAIDKCYSIGLVTGTTNKGGLIGLSEDPSAVTASFWDKEKSGMDASSGGVLKFTSEMKTQATFTDAGWDFITPVWGMNSLINVGYAYLSGDPPPADYTWTGVSNSNWNTPANWNAGAVPHAGDNAIIPDVATAPIVNQSPDSPAVCNNLTIEAGASLVISTGKALTVNGILTNNAGNTGLMIQSNGSLIHHTTNVSGAVQRSIEKDNKYHVLSSPLSSDAPICDGFFAPTAPNFNPGTGTTFGFFKWSEPIQPGDLNWLNLKNADYSLNTADFGADPQFEKGKGYLVLYKPEFAGNAIKVFTGTLGEGNVSIPVTASGNMFNLVGNPFPSFIDWNSTSGWNRSKLATSGGGYNYWVWNGTFGNYGVYNSATGLGNNGATRYIAPEQGFFIEATSAGSLTLSNTVRSHASQSWLKAGSNTLSIKVSSGLNEYADEILLKFNHPVPGGAKKWFSIYGEAPSLFLPVEGSSYSLRFLGAVEENHSIPVGFRSGVDGSYTLTITGAQDFPDAVLMDRKTGVLTDIKANPLYPFTYSSGDDTERFLLQFNPAGVKTNGQMDNSIYLWNDILYIINPGESTVEVYNLIGQKVSSEQTHGEQVYRMELQGVTGYYLVRMISGQKLTTKKMFLK